MKTPKPTRSGMTLVEVMIAMFLVSMAAVIVYTEMLAAYRMLVRSRARLDAQTIVFDTLWDIYCRPQETMPVFSSNSISATPAGSVFGTAGLVECTIISAPQSNPDYPSPVGYWDISVQLWPPVNSLLSIGSNSLARYTVRRYWRYGR